MDAVGSAHPHAEHPNTSALWAFDMSLVSSLWIGKAKILAVPFLTMLLLYTGYTIYYWVFPQQKATESQSKGVRAIQAPFRMSTSLLDSQGNVLLPWMPQPTPIASVRGYPGRGEGAMSRSERILPPSGSSRDGSVEPAVSAGGSEPGGGDDAGQGARMGEYDGFYNLLLVILFLYITSNALYNAMSFGSLWRDHGAFVWAVVSHAPELLRDWCILALTYFTFTLGYQYLVIYGFLAGWRAYALQIVAETAMLAGCVSYSLYQTSWPVTQRAAWLIETTVLIMKMHSYIVVNRHLKQEVESGGPGTGAIISQFVPPENSTTGNASRDRHNGSHPPAHVETEASHNGADVTPSPAVALSPQSPRGARRRKTSQGPQRAAAPSPLPASRGHAASNRAPNVGAGTGTSKEQQQQLASSPGGTPAKNSSSEYALAGHIRYYLEPSTNGDSKSAWSRRREIARTLIGKVVYGLNYEGQITTTGIVAYPNNVSVRDFLLYSFAPVLCYEPNYPRTTKIRFGYLAEKIFLAAGLITAGTYIHSHYILPVVSRIHEMDEMDATVQIVGPVIALMLICFFVVFECILNAFAELTYFGDRTFYEAWWNATTFMEWSRKWNQPVHLFLKQHIYLDAMRQYGATAKYAMYATFLVSIILHEVILWGVIGPCIPWLALFSLLQLPLGTIQRVKYIKGKRLGNLIMWMGLCIGVTLITVLYSKEYCERNPAACRAEE